MSSQQKSLLIDSPTQLSGAKRTLADDDAQSTNGVVIATNTNDGINKLVTAAATNDGAENAEENANVDGDAIDTVRVNKKSKHAEVPDETSGAVDVEAAKDAFVQQSAQLKHDALEIKEQTEATLDKLNEVHYELVKNTNALLSAVDPNLAAVIADTEQRITAVEEAAVRADCADAAKPDDSNLVVVATTTETAATDTEAPSQVATTADADTAAN